MARSTLAGAAGLAGALALGLSFAPHALVAQNYQQQVQNWMTQHSAAVRNQGFSAVTPMVTGSANGGSTGTHPVTLVAGRAYAIVGVCDNDCTDVDLRLWGPDGSRVAEDLLIDDHPTLRFVAPSNGNYRLDVIMATCARNPCYYGVQLFSGGSGVAMNQPQPMNMPQPMNVSAPTQMGQIAANQQVTGNLTVSDGRWDNKPTQTWAFQCQAGQAIQMDILSTWDNYAIVFDPFGAPVAHDDDSGEGLNARVNYTCGATGVYRLGITTFTSSTQPGTYTLQVQSMGVTTLNQPQPMNVPQPMNTPQAMQPVTQAAPGATMPAPAPVNLPITGTIPAPGQIGTITLGTNVQGRLETGDQRMNDGTWADVWQFQGRQGQRVIIELRSEEFDTYLQLLDAQGTRLAEDDDSLGDLDSKVEFVLPSSGMFQIVVNNFSDERRAGVYTLTLR